MPILLELFCGTKSVSKVFETAGWEVISVDIEKKFNPTICCSVLDIPLDKWEPGHFDYIHASPPCCEYSIAHTGNARDLEKADALAMHTLNLIRSLNPAYYTIENPQSGKLKDRIFMQGLSFSDVSHCKYGFPYRKNTRIWHNLFHWLPLSCKNDCNSRALNSKGRMVHLTSAQKGPSKGTANDVCYTSEQLYRIPPKLVESILQAILDASF